MSAYSNVANTERQEPSPSLGKLRILDLFCGIGGAAEATRNCNAKGTANRSPRVVAAMDIDRRLIPIYQANHGVRPRVGAIESLTDSSQIRLPKAKESHQPSKDFSFAANFDMWWLSPPCQPYTQRGKQRAEDDPRSAGLERILELLHSIQPQSLGLENVPAFEDSRHHRLLEQTLDSAGYNIRKFRLCPTEWGIPMRRERFYLLAVQAKSLPRELSRQHAPSVLQAPLRLTAWDDRQLHVERDQLNRYATAMNILDADDASAVAACFTSAYGSSPVRAGSYLRCTKRNIVRRFAADEIASLMGFRPHFDWGTDLNLRAKYRLIGNSLCVPVVRDLLRMVCTDS